MSQGPYPLRPFRPPYLEEPAVHPGWNGGFRPVRPAGPPARRQKVWLHVLLFVLTAVSTTLVNGPLYSICLLSILTAHEFGHYFAAKYHRVPATLPYFIPFPSILGTLGAVIRMSPYLPNRRALFDIAAAGPIAGLVVAVPVTFIGVATSTVIQAAQTPENSISLGDTLLFRAIQYVVLGPMPPGAELMLNGIAFAGWVGLFVTALNLLPIGQLDGGHVCYALFGRRARLVAGLTFLVLGAVTAMMGLHYLIILVLLWVMGIKHPPTMNDYIPLSRRRRQIGYALALVFIVSFSPAPFELGNMGG